MSVTAKNATDVFIYLGDASATGADEIGTAMQRAAASAETFGLSIEWLGAYIATISEKTRLAPEAIGTAINTLMSRLRAIREKGWNEEDNTRINDVAKALGTIDVALLDQQENWRGLDEIFLDVAQKWDGLNGKQQAYIATAIAGTRQQNFFLTLMNDLAKSTEGNSRAVELYNGALNSAGTTAQKFVVWQESVAAAENRLAAATQDLYALLDAEWLKSFYNGMAGLVEIMARGTEATRGMNLVLPIAIVAFVGLAAVIHKVQIAYAAAATTAAAFKAIAFGPMGIIAAVAAIAGVTAIAGGISQAIQPTDYSGQINSTQEQIDRISA